MKKIDWKILWQAFKETTVKALMASILVSFVIAPIFMVTISGGNLWWLFIYLIELYLFAIWRDYDTKLKNKNK